MSSLLEAYGCLNCGRIVTVARFEPYVGKREPTGIWVSEFDDSGNDVTIGVLCWACLDKLSRFVGVAFGGGLLPKAYVNENFPIKHPEFLLEEEESNIV